jgi:hypothetical protein
LRRRAIDSGPFSSLVTGRASRSWSALHTAGPSEIARVVGSLALLRLRGQRPHRRSAEQRDERGASFDHLVGALTASLADIQVVCKLLTKSAPHAGQSLLTCGLVASVIGSTCTRHGLPNSIDRLRRYFAHPFLNGFQRIRCRLRGRGAIYWWEALTAPTLDSAGGLASGAIDQT